MSNFCVNIKGKEFKTICEKYKDVNPIEIEYAIKEWMDSENTMWTESNTDAVDKYIRNKFNIDTVRVINDAKSFKYITEFYNKYGNINNISKEQAIEIYNEITKITDADNVSIYMNSNGSWNIRMKMPSYEGMTSEMQSIKEKAIADGTFMKAPNGKDTNLTERQWLQVRTKAFKDWFGDWEELVTYENTTKYFENLLRKAEKNSISIYDYIANIKSEINELKEKSKTETYLYRYTIDKIEHLNKNLNLLESLIFNIDVSKIKLYKKSYDRNSNDPLGTFNPYTNTIVHNGVFEVIFHEIIHSLTYNKYHNDVNFKNEVDSLYSYIKNNLPIIKNYLDVSYALSSPTELLAEFAHEKFRKVLQQIPSQKTIIDKLIELFRNLLNIQSENRTALDDLFEIIYNNRGIEDRNIPKNVSKVVDENGEPLVVYHGTNDMFTAFDINTFGKNISSFNDINQIDGFFFTSSYNSASTYGKNVYGVFLNIRNPEILHQEKNEFGWRKLKFTDIFKIKLSENKDGIIAEDILDSKYVLTPTTNETLTKPERVKEIENFNNSLYGNDYIVKNPNQIKSATDNVGTFSAENDDIRYNQEMSELFDVIDYISRKEKFVMPVEDGQTQNYELLSKYHKRYYLPKTFGTEEQIRSKLETYLIVNDLPRDTVAFERTRSGRLVAYFNEDAIKDSIERNEANAEIGDLFSTPEETQSVTTVLNKLSAITGLKYKTITESEANELVKGKDFSSTNAFVYNDTCYFIQGRKLNTDIAAEEMLHPFIAAVRKYNPKAFDSLLRDARRAFPKLRLEVAKTYDENKSVRDEELVTQALSRAFRKDIKDNPEGHKLKNLIKNFINYVRDIFRSFVNINGRTTQYFTNIDNILQNKEVKAEDLVSNISITELAKVINSDIEKLESDTKVFRQNIADPNQMLRDGKITDYVDFCRNFNMTDKQIRDNIARSRYGRRFKELYDTKEIPDIEPAEGRELVALETFRDGISDGINFESFVKGLIATRRNKLDKVAYVKELKENYPIFKSVKSGNTTFAELADSIQYAYREGEDESDNLGADLIADIVNEYKSLSDLNDAITGKTRKLRTVEEKLDYAAKVLTDEIAEDNYYKSLNILSENQEPDYTQQPVFEQQEEEIKEEIKQQDEVTEELQIALGTDAVPVISRITNPIQQQFDNLAHPDLKVEGNSFPLKERMHFASTLVNYTSLTITQWMEQTPEFINGEFEDCGLEMRVNPKSDFSKMNRRQFIEGIGLNNILLYIREKYFNPAYQFVGDALIEKLQLVYDNFNAICLMANKDMILCEGFTIEARFNNVGSTNNSDTDSVQDDFESEAQEIGETNAWGVRAKSISASSSLAQYIKRKLRTTSVKDNNGDSVTDEYGYGHNVYYDPDATVTLLLDKCSGATTLSGMIKSLEKESMKFPNLRGVLELMRNDKEFADKFFSNFFKDQNKFYTVAKIWDENRKTYLFKVIPANTNGFGKEFKKHINNAIYRNEFKILPESKNGKIKYEDAKKAYDALNRLYETGKRLREESAALFNQHSKERTQCLGEFIKMLGVDDMFDLSVTEKLADSKRDFSNFIKAIGTIVDVYERASLTDNTKILDIANETVANDGVFNMQSSTRFMKALSDISNILSDYAGVRIEPYVYEGGKSYYAYSNPSFIGTLTKIMRNPEMREKYIEEEMATRFMFQYEEENGMLKRRWFNDVMSYLDTEDGTNDDFDHQVLLTFDGEDYTNMGIQAFDTCCILNYFSDPKSKTAWYKIPIFSDKPSFEFLKMRRKPYYKMGDTLRNDGFLDSFYWNVVQECIRINTVLRRYYKDNIETVEHWDIKKTDSVKGLGNSFDSLTLKQFQSVFPNLLNSGASFHFFPVINDIIEGKIGGMPEEDIKRLQSNLFNMIKGRPVDNDNWFMDTVKNVIEKWMYNLEESEIANMDKLGLFEFDSEKRDKPDGTGVYYIPKPVFLEGLLFTKGKDGSAETRTYKDYAKPHLKYGSSISKRIDIIIKEAAKKENGINDVLDDEIIAHLAEYGIIKYENGKVFFTEAYKDSTNTILYELVEKDMLNTILDNVREYVWGNYYGSVNIVQLTVTDPAYFRDAIDFQKRYAMTHAPGIRPNTEAVFENGKPVSDGRMRVMTLKDNKVKSAYIDDIRTVFTQAAAKQPAGSPAYEYYTDLANSVESMFGNINQTDAQAYSSPTAMMKELRMYGDWDTQKEAAYNAILNGSRDIATMKQLFNVIKPFVGGTTLQSTFVGNENETGAISKMRTPVQNKNSKYMILLADALARSSQGEYGFILQGIHDFMESTHFNSDVHNYDTYSPTGIDCLQFESAFKVGQSGLVNLNECKNAKEAMLKLREYAYMKDANGVETYNPNYVSEFSFDITSHQQEVPNHMKDHEQLDGSQKRPLITADQDLTGTVVTPTGEINTGEAIKEYKELVGKQVDTNAKELLGDLLLDKDAFMDKLTPVVEQANKEKTPEDAVRKFRTLLNNRFKNIGETLRKRILDSYRQGINASDMGFEISEADKNEVFSIFLQDSVKNDAKYDSDTLIGLLVNETGDFTIPVADMMQSKKLQQITYALIKNRINKLKRKGGPAVQVSSYGIGKDLKVVWKTDKNGNKCIDHMECYISVPSEEMERRLTVKETVFNPSTNSVAETTRLMTPDEAIMAGVISEDDLRAIGHRIPTEDTYSIIPMRIVGFLPKAGDAIMLPPDHVQITGSDFDVDKFYIEFRESARRPNKQFFIDEFNKKLDTLDIDEEGKQHLRRKFKEDLPKILNNVNFSISDPYHIDTFNTHGLRLDDTAGMANVDFIAELFSRAKSNPEIMKQLYIDAGTDTYEGRANRIFDLEYALLQTRESTEKMFNPGNFQKLIDLSKEAAEITGDNNYLNIFTQTTDSYFYGQNTAAKIMIGLCANNSTAHAFLQYLDIPCKLDSSFLYHGTPVTGLVLDVQRGMNGKLVSKTVGSTVGAAADASKEPVFRNLNLTPKTMPVAMFLWRTGFSEEFTTWLITHPIIRKITDNYERESSYKNISFSSVIRDEFKSMGYTTFKEISEHVKETLGRHDFTEEDMKAACKRPDNDNSDAALCLFYNLIAPAEELNELTYITKINSITNAAGPDFSETYEMQMRISVFLRDCYYIKKEDVQRIMKSDPILYSFYSNTIGEAGDPLSGQNKDGVVKQVFERYYPQYSPAFKRVLNLYAAETSTRPNANTIDRLYSFYMTYNATAEHEHNGKIIGKVFDSTVEGRTDLQSEKTVKEFMNYIARHKDNEFLKLFSIREKDTKCGTDTIETDINGASSDYIDTIKSDWDALLNNSDSAILQKMMQYFIFRSGFRYNPKLPLHLANTSVKLALSNYIDFLNAMVGYSDISDDTCLEIIEQFMRNNTNNSSIVPELYEKSLLSSNVSIGGTSDTMVLEGPVSSLRQVHVGIDSYNRPIGVPVIKINGTVYRYTPENSRIIDEKTVSLCYEKTTTLGINGYFVEADSDVAKPKTIFSNSIGEEGKTGGNKENADAEAYTGGSLLAQIQLERLLSEINDPESEGWTSDTWQNVHNSLMRIISESKLSESEMQKAKDTADRIKKEKLC